jgi:hypothetical protein
MTVRDYDKDGNVIPEKAREDPLMLEDMPTDLLRKIIKYATKLEVREILKMTRDEVIAKTGRKEMVMLANMIKNATNNDIEMLMEVLREQADKTPGMTLMDAINKITLILQPWERDTFRNKLIEAARKNGDYSKVVSPKMSTRPFLTPMEEVTGG